MEKKDKNLNVPNLRFPEFSGEWETSILLDVCEINPKTPSLDEEFVYIDLESVEKGTILHENVISRDDAPSRAQRVLKFNDILFQCVRPYQKNNLLFAGYTHTLQYVASTGYAQIRTDKQNPAFLYQLLNTQKFVDQVMLRCTGTSYPAINANDLSKIPICYPLQIEEQNKIAKLLSLLDNRIETQKKIIEKYESLIRGLYQLLFQNTKYNDFVSLGDISQISNGNSDVKDASMSNDGSLYPFFDRSDEIKFLPEYLFDKEAIIYPGEGSVFYPRYYNGKFALHQRCYAIYDISTDFIPRYLYHYCKTQNSYFVRNAVGSTVASLRIDTFKRLKIPAIPTHHQESLVMFLDKIEAKIECNRTILKKYEEQKKYLLSTLFK